MITPQGTRAPRLKGNTNMKIHMTIRWYENKPDMRPDWTKEHRLTITGDTPEECMRKHFEHSYYHDCYKYTAPEIINIFS